jgi:hypothetical protein
LEMAMKIYKGEKGAEQITFAGGNTRFMALP